ncbi:SusC/RagA family TonB-linked outer membrane protein [Mucilaginibacter aquariorum]|uniref:SusC/RagA family TonB-linked outer membrane protein n=1 Tax=Mucilaginibacter aquariorum TaxID=2967225 RepID=A0ABT1T0E3_9SPHI|nr:SusC/RagA family TonB-linked outer membrane protein [Mucilaginibacter aquariorum]MCQ6958068.1 SusC/RagA family TonB-linked outer membrane protein [Mucilaginibacter aquariorum]
MQFKHLLTLCFFALTCLFVQPALAQNKVVTGKVTDKKDNSPLIGVSVGAAGGIGTLTSVDGTFRLSVPASTTALTFTYIGFKNLTVPLNGQSSIAVSLESASTALNEVVVIGYGTQRVKDATGSVSSLSPKDFNKGVIATPEQLLQGRIAGVQVTPSSGEPGAAATINIRGASSIRAGTSPLYVVDGVPLDNGGTSGGYDSGAGTSTARNPLAFLNPADIENISVLKDASASAIYGSRGANGVILITTRKGRKGQGIQFGASTSVSKAAKTYDVLGREDFLKAVESVGADPAAADYGGNTDWQKEILRTAVSQNYNIAFGGASNTGNYRASAAYDNQQGIVKNTNLQRFTARFNGSQSFFGERLKFELQSLFSNVQDRFAPITNNAGFNGSLIGTAIQTNPTIPIFDAQGRYFNLNGYDAQGFPNGTSFRNPVSLLNQIDDTDNINRYLNNLTMTLRLIEGLSYRGNISIDKSRGARKTFYDPNIVGFTDAGNIRGLSFPSATGNGRSILQNTELSNLTTEHTLNYEKKFSNNSSITALAGYSYSKYDNFPRARVGWGAKGNKTFIKDFQNTPNKYPFAFGDSTTNTYRLQSYFARVNYSYKDRYILTATVRRDGSTRFGDENHYANFPALAAKWRISGESWAPKGIFDDLSLRLNYGKTGNQDYPSLASKAIRSIDYYGGTTADNAANPTLKWETQTAYGAGLDFSVLRGRLTGTIDYFNKSQKDLLFLQDVAQPAAVSRFWVNLPGNVRNTGIEVGLNFAAIQASDAKGFSWDVNFNTTFIKNRIENFGNRNVITGNIDGQGLSGAYAQFFGNGYPLYEFNVSQYNGLDDQGFGIYPDGIDAATPHGSPLPTFYGGLNNTFSYGNWNLSFFLSAQTGFYIYNNTANAFFYKGNLVSGRNVTKEVAATNENPLNSGEVSSRFLEKGDFLRLQNAALGYTFPLSGGAIKSLRVSLTGQNLFLITGYSGIDPEINTNKERNGVPSRGIDYTAYPSARTFTLGLNASF